MAENSDPELYSMHNLQQEAIRRAREMQARAQIPPSYPARPAREDGAPPPAQNPDADPPGRQNPPGRQSPPGGRKTAPAQEMPAGQAIGGALDFLTKDSERSMLLILLLILIEEKADTSVIFALMYLLI